MYSVVSISFQCRSTVTSTVCVKFSSFLTVYISIPKKIAGSGSQQIYSSKVREIFLSRRFVFALNQRMPACIALCYEYPHLRETMIESILRVDLEPGESSRKTASLCSHTMFDYSPLWQHFWLPLLKSGIHCLTVWFHCQPLSHYDDISKLPFSIIGLGIVLIT